MHAYLVTLALGVVAFLFLFFVSPPSPYPEVILKVEPGQSVQSVARELKESGVVRSPRAFSVFARLFGGVQAGWYGLAEPETVISLALRFARGDTELDALTVVIPEGSTVREISTRLGVELPRSEEGYLFPDTYAFLPGTSPEVIVERMRARYEEQVGPLRDAIRASGRGEEEIVIMASILEKEARLTETRRIVAGILWKRLDMGMPLQVDAVFGYIHDTETYNPTFKDLEVDSPYNTYKYRGLPPGPINNPGVDALKAALNPTKSPYLYYLTGKDGTMHYARTFDEHVANRKYLR